MVIFIKFYYSSFFHYFFIFCLFIFIFVLLFYSNCNFDSDDELFLPTTLDTLHLSSEFGYREIYGNINFHNGIDFPVPENTPIYAASSGVVTYSDFLSGYGICVTIVHDNGLKSLYGHLSEKYHIDVGSYVSKGDIIAYVGPKYLSDGRLNGFTTGPHLHFSIFDSSGQALNPLNFSYKKR